MRSVLDGIPVAPSLDCRGIDAEVLGDRLVRTVGRLLLNVAPNLGRRGRQGMKLNVYRLFSSREFGDQLLQQGSGFQQTTKANINTIIRDTHLGKSGRFIEAESYFFNKQGDQSQKSASLTFPKGPRRDHSMLKEVLLISTFVNKLA